MITQIVSVHCTFIALAILNKSGVHLDSAILEYCTLVIFVTNFQLLAQVGISDMLLNMTILDRF